MFAVLLCIPAILVTSGSYAGATWFGIPVIYVLLGTLFVSYACCFAMKWEALSLRSAEKCLLALVGWGLIYVVLSFLKVNRVFDADLAYETSYIPRQAVYFAVFPAAILFRENLYLKNVERFLKRYGEILFWVLYIYHMYYFQDFTLTVIAQILLCWLSLHLETNQRWRRWLRIIALVALPLPDYGELTILIVRAIFLAICVVPKQWSRTMLCLMAVVVFAVVVTCFILPQVTGEGTFSDASMTWRMRIWKEEETILKNTHFIGAGYGTSYPSQTYAKEAVARFEGQYRAEGGYTEYERMFVTAPHNSFMALTMRTGIIGLVLFLSYLILLFRNLVRHKPLPPKSACFALFAGIILILFNVGLESPGYLLTFVFCIGVCARAGKKLEDQDRILLENGETA